MHEIDHAASEGLKETGRVEAFSDGVFAIAITLLILDIKAPNTSAAAGDLLRALLAQWPTYVAFLSSFATIGSMWINHHRLFTHIGRADNVLLQLNLLLLLGVTVVPFPTSVLARNLGGPDATAAAVFYSLVSIAIAIFFNLLWRYSAGRDRLLAPGHNHTLVDAITRQYRFGPLFYVVTTLVALVSPLLSVALCLGLAVFFVVTPSGGAADGTSHHAG